MPERKGKIIRFRSSRRWVVPSPATCGRQSGRSKRCRIMLRTRSRGVDAVLSRTDVAEFHVADVGIGARAAVAAFSASQALSQFPLGLRMTA